MEFPTIQFVGEIGIKGAVDASTHVDLWALQRPEEPGTPVASFPVNDLHVGVLRFGVHEDVTLNGELSCYLGLTGEADAVVRNVLANAETIGEDALALAAAVTAQNTPAILEDALALAQEIVAVTDPSLLAKIKALIAGPQMSGARKAEIGQ